MFVAGALPALVLVPLMIRYLSGPDAQGATAMPVTRSGRARRETISGLFRGVQLRTSPRSGSVADLRAQHLASRDHARCRVLSGQFARISADPQSGSHPRIFLGRRFADRGGVRRTTIGWFAGAAIFLAVF